MVNKIKIDKDDDHYEPSDSEDDYTERDKKLLKKVRNRKKRDVDDKVAVLGFDDEVEDDEDDDDFDDKFEGESDFEEDDLNDGVPDSRAWGKKRKDFYSTDFVDQDYSSYTDKEAELAEQEELESKAIQLRLAQQLNEADFTLNVYETAAVAEKEETTTKTHLKSDLSDLSHRQKIQLFRKDSPEFEGLVQDFQQNLEESKTLLEPILDYVKTNQLPSLPIFEFVSTKNNLILTYCSNVSFYLVLKAQRSAIKNHPLVKRLVQMRQLLQQLQEKYDRVIKPQLEQLLQDIREGHEIKFTDPSKKVAKKTKKLQLLRTMDVDGEKEEESDEEVSKEISNMETDSENGQEDDEEENPADDGADDRRQITYQMSKNKGLTPHRKKELRNPRVKHRNKFRKAIIRRKGAVRTVRKELKRYGGEVSGIKATTKKGIKIH